VEHGQLLEDDRGRQRQPHHLLADRDRVLVEGVLLVGIGGGEVALRGAAVVALLVEQIGEEDEVVGIGIVGSDQLFVLARAPSRSPFWTQRWARRLISIAFSKLAVSPAQSFAGTNGLVSGVQCSMHRFQAAPGSRLQGGLKAL
jgi:hypothetical protein